MTLPHRVVQSPLDDGSSAPLLLLHGFLGAGRNWASFARRLVDLRADWYAVLVDLPYHGDARASDAAPTVAAAAGAVADLLESLVEQDGARRRGALLGHSFGGKVALVAAGESRAPPAQTWAIDSTPTAGGTDGSAAGMLGRLAASPAAFADREAAVGFIRDGGFDDATARWMATNLTRDGDVWHWALDHAPLARLLADFRATDAWPAVEQPRAGSDIHFVRATRGSILTPADVERLARLSAQGEPVELHELEGGHWLHVDNPDGLLALVADGLPRG